MFKENFSNRHIGPNSSELEIILKTIGVESVEELLNQTIPDNIRLKKDLDIPEGISEMEFLNEIKKLQSKGEYRTPPVRMDEKDFGIGAQILHDLKIHKIRLLTNSTQIKRVGMVGYGLEIVEYINY